MSLARAMLIAILVYLGTYTVLLSIGMAVWSDTAQACSCGCLK